jgi:hypothetical protein
MPPPTATYEQIDALTRARAFAATHRGDVRTLVEMIDQETRVLEWAVTQLAGPDPGPLARVRVLAKAVVETDEEEIDHG